MRSNEAENRFEPRESKKPITQLNKLLLRNCPEHLKLDVGGARCVDKQLAPKRKELEIVRNAQAFQLERGVNGHENMIALGPQRSRGRLG